MDADKYKSLKDFAHNLGAQLGSRLGGLNGLLAAFIGLVGVVFILRLAWETAGVLIGAVLWLGGPIVLAFLAAALWLVYLLI